MGFRLRNRALLREKYVKVVGSVDKWVSNVLGELGFHVARRPIITAAASGIIAIMLMGGLVMLERSIETEAEKLWVPQNSIWLKQEEYLTPRLGRTDRVLRIIFEAKEDSGSVLTEPALREMFGVLRAVRSIEVNPAAFTPPATSLQDQVMAGAQESDEGGAQGVKGGAGARSVAGRGPRIGWENGVCWQDASGNCRSAGVLRYFADNETVFNTVAAQGHPVLLEALSASTYPDGTPANTNGSFAEYSLDANGTLESASMAMWVGQLDPSLPNPEASSWSTAIEKLLEQEDSSVIIPPLSQLKTIKYYFATPESVNNAVEESVGDDLALVVVAFLAICAFTCAALFIKDTVYGRISLALEGVGVVAVSIGAGFGLALYMQVPFTSLSQMLPFILLGIGVDDILVLVRSLDEVTEAHPRADIPERFRKALRKGGTSVAVTSVTNTAAFLFGSLTSIPAVRWFCWTAAIAVVVLFALQATLFVACVALNERRIAARRYDILCCCPPKPKRRTRTRARAPLQLGQLPHQPGGTTPSYNTNTQSPESTRTFDLYPPTPPMPPTPGIEPPPVATAAAHSLCLDEEFQKMSNVVPENSAQMIKDKKDTDFPSFGSQNIDCSSTIHVGRESSTPLEITPENSHVCWVGSSPSLTVSPAPKRSTTTTVTSQMSEISEERTVTTRGMSAPRQRPTGIMSSSSNSWLQKLLGDYMLPCILHPIGKALVVLGALLIVVLGIVSFFKVQEGLPLESLAPEGHAYGEFAGQYSAFKRQTGDAARIYFRHVDPSLPAVQRQMLFAHQFLVLDSPYVSQELSPPVNWLSSFQAFVGDSYPEKSTEDGAVRQSAFYELLREFLEASPEWTDDIYIPGDNLVPGGDNSSHGFIEVSSFPFVLVANVDDSGDYNRKLLQSMLSVQTSANELFAASGMPGDGSTFRWVCWDREPENRPTNSTIVLPVVMLSSPYFKYSETDRIIQRELLVNLGFAVLGVTIISLFTLVHPGAVALIVLCVVLVDLGLFMELWVLRIRLNTVSVVNLVMAVGLAVDYALHILHKYLHTSGDTKEERARAAVRDIGSAVLLGVLSTLLGVLVLAGTRSHILRTFFQLLMGTVVLGGAVALITLPVLLTIIGPNTTFEDPSDACNPCIGPPYGDRGGREAISQVAPADDNGSKQTPPQRKPPPSTPPLKKSSIKTRSSDTPVAIPDTPSVRSLENSSRPKHRNSLSRPLSWAQDLGSADEYAANSAQNPSKSQDQSQSSGSSTVKSKREKNKNSAGSSVLTPVFVLVGDDMIGVNSLSEADISHSEAGARLGSLPGNTMNSRCELPERTCYSYHNASLGEIEEAASCFGSAAADSDNEEQDVSNVNATPDAAAISNLNSNSASLSRQMPSGSAIPVTPRRPPQDFDTTIEPIDLSKGLPRVVQQTHVHGDSGDEYGSGFSLSLPMPPSTDLDHSQSKS